MAPCVTIVAAPSRSAGRRRTETSRPRGAGFVGFFDPPASTTVQLHFPFARAGIGLMNDGCRYEDDDNEPPASRLILLEADMSIIAAPGTGEH
jgi:hypothetical protein